VTNDIKNLLSRFGANFEDYLEFDDVHQYREPPGVNRPPPGMTRVSPQAEGQVYIAAVPEAVAAVFAAVVQPAAGRHASLRSRLNPSVMHGQAS